MQMVSVGGIRENQGWVKTDTVNETVNETGNINNSGTVANEVKDEEAGVTLEISEKSMESYKQMLEEMKKSADNAKDAFNDLAKLMEIARRIANGDKVPRKDEQKLMEFNNELYQAAKAAAMLNAHRKHKEYDSLFDEEKKNVDEKARELDREEEAPVSESEVCADASAEVTVDEVEE